MKYLALVPFGYSLVTRLTTLRDLLYLVATQWIPGVWLIHRLGEVDLLAALGLYAISYLAFMSIYEIGYFVNDTWDARRRPAARHRFPYDLGLAYTRLFLFIHILAWVAISIFLGFALRLQWIIAYTSLVIIVTLYNTDISDTLRTALFIQLTYLRYIIPVFMFMDDSAIPVVFIVCTFSYMYFRFLSFLDSKNFLHMPDRKTSYFGVSQIILLFPVTLLAAYITKEEVILEIFAICLATYGLYFIGSFRRLK